MLPSAKNNGRWNEVNFIAQNPVNYLELLRIMTEPCLVNSSKNVNTQTRVTVLEDLRDVINSVKIMETSVASIRTEILVETWPNWISVWNIFLTSCLVVFLIILTEYENIQVFKACYEVKTYLVGSELRRRSPLSN